MSEIGKKIRIERLMNRESRNMVVIPMDHGSPTDLLKGLSTLPTQLIGLPKEEQTQFSCRKAWSSTGTEDTAMI